MLCAALFCRDPHLVSVKPGTPLFAKGGQADPMYVLARGDAQILVKGHEVERLMIGDPVGEMSLIDKAAHSATVMAITDCEFVCIDERHFNFMVTETPSFAIDLMRTMARRLSHADQSL